MAVAALDQHPDDPPQRHLSAFILDHTDEFDLWHNILRELSEEFLGNPEHDGSSGPIDYEDAEPFRTLNQARREERPRASLSRRPTCGGCSTPEL